MTSDNDKAAEIKKRFKTGLYVDKEPDFFCHMIRRLGPSTKDSSSLH